jgi:hypothetical protein
MLVQENQFAKVRHFIQGLESALAVQAKNTAIIPENPSGGQVMI